MNSVSIVITSFNGRHLLEKHLPNVLKHSKIAKQIFVYDDAGDDDTPEWIAKEYPKIVFKRNLRNLGFTKNTNQAINNCDTNFVVLLNNDVSPNKGYLENSLRHFTDPKVVSVTFAEREHSWPKVSWYQGKLSFVEGENRDHTRLCAWPSGGSSIVKKTLWTKIGGYNEIYSPGYWEDIDFGWRALKQGYKIIWDPESSVDHQHESTFKKLSKNFVNLIKQRNELLFIWQNITDHNLIKTHWRFLSTHTMRHPGYVKVILAAARFYPLVTKSRLHNQHLAKLTDHQVLSLLS